MNPNNNLDRRMVASGVCARAVKQYINDLTSAKRTTKRSGAFICRVSVSTRFLLKVIKANL